MLTQLHIQGLAIIDSLTIQFSRGFNVITGETGAGKSILIKALGLLLGAKASPETVRHGRENATVSGVFEIPGGHRCISILERFGVELGEIESKAAQPSLTMVVRRQINNKGRSLAWIGDMPVTVAVLREVGATLIDVFGQHDSLRILDASQHTSYVDLFLQDWELPSRYSDAYGSCQTQIANLHEMVAAARGRAREADYLRYRCEELCKFAPSAEDYHHAQSLCQNAAGQIQLKRVLIEAQQRLELGGREGDGLGGRARDVGRQLGRLPTLAGDATLVRLIEQANVAAEHLDQLSFDLGRAIDRLDIDESELEAAQSRLAGYQDLFRKLGVDGIEAMMAEWDQLSTDVEAIDGAGVRIGEALRVLHTQVTDLDVVARRLSSARQVAKEIAKVRLQGELHELVMPGARIDIEFAPVARALPDLGVDQFGSTVASLWAEVVALLVGLGECGAEKAQFLLAANPGEPLMPLAKVASGGEVSRLMLALKKALAAGADTCILVFDEIDSGISGRVADVVGKKMQELAASFQVICISHLAQVAAYADAHFLVHKFGQDKRTQATISRLSTEASEAEIARLLSASEITDSSLANARALIKKARRKSPPPVQLR